MNTNIMNFMKMVQTQKNPEQYLLSMLEQGNPMFQNMAELVKTGKGNEIESIVRNILKEKGFDFDKEFATFKQFLS